MLSFYICAIVTAASAFTSLGFSIAALNTSQNETDTNAMYAVARNVALAATSLIPFFYHAESFLVAIALTMIVVQSIDAVIGIKIRNNLKTFGPAATALFNLLALVCLLS